MSRRLLLHFTTLLCGLVLAVGGHAQAFALRAHVAYGTNLLTSPGTDLQSAPGRTGLVDISAIIGHTDRKVAVITSLRAGQHAFRTRMGYRVHYTTTRTQFDLDLAIGLRQMSGTMWRFGGFVGQVTRMTSRIEQRSGNNAFPRYPPITPKPEQYDRMQLGVLIGLMIPLDAKHRWDLDLMLRHHFTPLATQEQLATLVHQTPQVVLSPTTRPSTFTVGLGYRLAGAGAPVSSNEDH